jgi:DNA repair exonuclease SbcCD nuclease subunit
LDPVSRQLADFISSAPAGRDPTIWMIPGNHDMASLDGSIHGLGLYKFVGSGLEIIDKPTTLHIAGADVTFVPYQRDVADLERILNEFRPTSGTRNILCCHTGIKDVEVHSGIVLEAGVIDPSFFIGWQLALVGHYHKQATGKYPGGTWVITGSPIQVDFSEELDNKCFSVIDTESMSLDFVYLDHPRFVTIQAPISDSINQLLMQECGTQYIRYVAQDSACTLEMVKASIKHNHPWTFVPKVDASSTVRVEITSKSSVKDMANKYVDFSQPLVKDLEKLKRIGEKYLNDSI